MTRKESIKFLAKNAIIPTQHHQNKFTRIKRICLTCTSIFIFIFISIFIFIFIFILIFIFNFIILIVILIVFISWGRPNWPNDEERATEKETAYEIMKIGRRELNLWFKSSKFTWRGTSYIVFRIYIGFYLWFRIWRRRRRRRRRRWSIITRAMFNGVELSLDHGFFLWLGDREKQSSSSMINPWWLFF